MTKVLRKSYGGYSAGTRVHEDGTITMRGGEIHTLDPDMLVTLRNRVDSVPATPRINRPTRLARRQLRLMFNGKG